MKRYAQFQFHKGTIRTASWWRWRLIGGGFQFHKGTIRTPKLVEVVHQLDIFQFHKGTIRTACWSPLASFLTSFQFHKGTIRTPSGIISYRAIVHFNFIKVRLERYYGS